MKVIQKLNLIDLVPVVSTAKSITITNNKSLSQVFAFGAGFGEYRQSTSQKKFEALWPEEGMMPNYQNTADVHYSHPHTHRC